MRLLFIPSSLILFIHADISNNNDNDNLTKNTTCIPCLHRECTDGTDICNQCPPGSFGLLCNETCPRRCTTDGCTSNGNCYICAPGYFGTTCEARCTVGSYGDRCRYECPRQCFNSICDHVTGKCLQGCQDGYIGSKCNATCPEENYGRDCLAKCPITCLNGSVCHHITGKCLYGCSNGFQGPRCGNVCEKGTYGQNCSQNCSESCFKQTCNVFSGHCYSCVSGNAGTFCENRLQAELGLLESQQLLSQHIDNLDSPKVILSSILGFVSLGIITWAIVGLATYYKHKYIVKKARKKGRPIPRALSKMSFWRGPFANLYGKRHMYTSTNRRIRERRKAGNVRRKRGQLRESLDTREDVAEKDDTLEMWTSLSDETVRHNLKIPEGGDKIDQRRIGTHRAYESPKKEERMGIRGAPRKVPIETIALTTRGESGDWYAASRRMHTRYLPHPKRAQRRAGSYSTTSTVTATSKITTTRESGSTPQSFHHSQTTTDSQSDSENIASDYSTSDGEENSSSTTAATTETSKTSSSYSNTSTSMDESYYDDESDETSPYDQSSDSTIKSSHKHVRHANRGQTSRPKSDQGKGTKKSIKSFQVSKKGKDTKVGRGERDHQNVSPNLKPVLLSNTSTPKKQLQFSPTVLREFMASKSFEKREDNKTSNLTSAAASKVAPTSPRNRPYQVITNALKRLFMGSKNQESDAMVELAMVPFSESRPFHPGSPLPTQSLLTRLERWREDQPPELLEVPKPRIDHSRKKITPMTTTETSESLLPTSTTSDTSSVTEDRSPNPRKKQRSSKSKYGSPSFYYETEPTS